jgi:hypothetical protein
VSSSCHRLGFDFAFQGSPLFIDSSGLCKRTLSAGVYSPRGSHSNILRKGSKESREYRERRERRERTVVSQSKSSWSEKQAVALEMEMSCHRKGVRLRRCGVAVRTGCKKPLQSPRKRSGDESGSHEGGMGRRLGIIVVAGPLTEHAASLSAFDVVGESAKSEMASDGEVPSGLNPPNWVGDSTAMGGRGLTQRPAMFGLSAA